MSDQPKPTGEWTEIPNHIVEDAVVAILMHVSRGGISPEGVREIIRYAINAALAAEREKREQIEIAIADLSHPNCQMLLRKEQQLREQLAEETENSTRLACELSTAQTKLAAAQASLKFCLENTRDNAVVQNRLADAIGDGTAALDAAEKAARNQGWNEGREHERKCASAAQQPLVELLQQIHDGDHGDTSNSVANVIVERLAKVKEVKV